MGLVDGLIGVLRFRAAAAFYISDLLMSRPALTPPPTPASGPVARLSLGAGRGSRPPGYFATGSPEVPPRSASRPRVQWQIAEFSRAPPAPHDGARRPQFHPESIFDAQSPSADSTTELYEFSFWENPAHDPRKGRRGRGHGQFLARAAYTLLLAFRPARIDPSFAETILADNPNPAVEPEIYVGSRRPRPRLRNRNAGDRRPRTREFFLIQSISFKFSASDPHFLCRSRMARHQREALCPTSAPPTRLRARNNALGPSGHHPLPRTQAIFVDVALDVQFCGGLPLGCAPGPR